MIIDSIDFMFDPFYLFPITYPFGHSHPNDKYPIDNFIVKIK